MSRRLNTGGRLSGRHIDRAAPLEFRFNGRRMRGFRGDTLASALLANGQMMVGRSFKYHRPRGIVAAGPEEPNALVNLGRGARLEPNQRATTTPLFEGLEAASQNHWPSLQFDIGAINARLSRFLPAGFYYKTFMWPRSFWKHVYEPIIRASAGLGKAPEGPDADTYEHYHAHVDVLVVGGGVAGLESARVAAEAGAQVLLVEQQTHWGGRAAVDGGTVQGEPADYWVQRTVEALAAMPNVDMRAGTVASGVYDHGYVLATERLAAEDVAGDAAGDVAGNPSAGDPVPGGQGPRQRLWRIRARRIVTATGAIERPLSFAGNDLPGVMLAGAVRDYVVNHAVAPGDAVVVVTNNDDGYRTALALCDAGVSVPAIIDARTSATGDLPSQARAAGLRIETGTAIGRVLGRRRVEAVEICPQAGDGKGASARRIDCDAVAMSGGWSPVVHLWSHCGGKLIWDEAAAAFRPDPDRPPLGADGKGIVIAAGSANGEGRLDAALEDGHRAGRAAIEATGHKLPRSAAKTAPQARAPQEDPLQPVWIMPREAGPAARAKMWLDFQNDVKVSDVQLAAREGYESVEHTKRYTTLGMATDQGKLSNINGLAVLSDALAAPIPSVGTTTFRPPYTPLTVGAIAGEARGDLFQPVRQTPIHALLDEAGATWEPVGLWRRPYAFPRSGETVHDAVMREVSNTRQAVGMLDASTLGKILVKGPDAGRFLDMLYTNMMSSLKPGRCRYGLMCSENGFLIDDGVVARIDDQTFLCHTTTGGADHIHAHMEEWLQTEWWDWKVYTANLTEQFAQVAVVGPQARALLESLGGDMDLSPEALPFMAWAEGTIGGIRARVFRISFSGELSFEVAVPAGDGAAFWRALMQAGQPLGVMPYGTEALHIMRAEKGFIMIGDESDGTVIPQDLGLGWAISKKKHDYLGKRAQARLHMASDQRWQLVGLETLDGSTLPDGAYAVASGHNDTGQRNMIGRVTSTYHSPTLGRGIAMGLVLHGPDRMGETLSFAKTDGTTVEAQIVDPVFYDREGARQNV